MSGPGWENDPILPFCVHDRLTTLEIGGRYTLHALVSYRRLDLNPCTSTTAGKPKRGSKLSPHDPLRVRWGRFLGGREDQPRVRPTLQTAANYRGSD